MKNGFLITTAFVAFAGAASAAEISGEATLGFAENAEGNWGAAMGLELGVISSTVGTVALGFEATPGGNLRLDTWTLGTVVGDVSVSVGNDNSVFVEGENGATLAAPTMAESVQVSMGSAAVAVGFTDWTSDITDISNVQGSYGLDAGIAYVTASGDYNLTSEDWVVGGRAVTQGLIDGVALGGTVTYGSANELFAFEADATLMGITAYVNGDQNEYAQNLGGTYTRMYRGMELEAGVNYNIDAAELTPAVSIAFGF